MKKFKHTQDAEKAGFIEIWTIDLIKDRKAFDIICKGYNTAYAKSCEITCCPTIEYHTDYKVFVEQKFMNDNGINNKFDFYKKFGNKVFK